jgi:hypothetical protein
MSLYIFFQKKLTTGEGILDQRYASQSTLVCLAENVRQSVTMITPARARKDEVVLTVKVSILTALLWLHFHVTQSRKRLGLDGEWG